MGGLSALGGCDSSDLVLLFVDEGCKLLGPRFGGAPTDLSGPSADPPGYFRVIATAVYTSQGRVMSFTITELVDGGAGTCSVDGTATPAS